MDGWETTQDDVLVVLGRHGRSLPRDSEELRDIANDLDHETIASVALDAAASDDIEDDLEKQTNAALSEIEAQLIEASVISGPMLFG